MKTEDVAVGRETSKTGIAGRKVRKMKIAGRKRKMRSTGASPKRHRFEGLPPPAEHDNDISDLLSVEEIVSAGKISTVDASASDCAC